MSRGDHPRRCGALMGYNAAALARKGSSPQVRGTLSGLAQRAKKTGIIPAGAGHFNPVDLQL